MKLENLLLPFFVAQLLISCTNSAPKNNEITEQITRDTIPFKISKANNIIFQTILNETDTIDLFFDTGGTDLILLHEAIKEKTSLLNGKNQNYKGEDFERLEEVNSLKIGSSTWDSLLIYPASNGPSEAAGHFGWDLFEDKIVELNYDAQLMIVHSEPIKIPIGYTKLEIEYVKTLFCIKGTAIVDNKSFPNRYLFDTGFQRAVVYDKEIRAEENFPSHLPVIKETVLTNSLGERFVNKVVNADQFCFNDLCLENVPLQLFALPNPARFKTNILGGELLKRYNTILDFQNDLIYLKPNSLVDLPYTDAL